MDAEKNPLAGLNILAVDDEADVLETIVDILDESHVDTARDYEGASRKIAAGSYNLTVLDIMGVDGLTLLQEAVAKGIPSVMLTAHAVNPQTLKKSIEMGALGYLPKEKLSEVDSILGELLAASQAGKSSWKLLFKRMGDFFSKSFGFNWQEDDPDFWVKYGAHMFF
ncbi:MAG: response regulator [Pseudomonadota bacterium]